MSTQPGAAAGGAAARERIVSIDLTHLVHDALAAQRSVESTERDERDASSRPSPG